MFGHLIFSGAGVHTLFKIMTHVWNKGSLPDILGLHSKTSISFEYQPLGNALYNTFENLYPLNSQFGPIPLQYNRRS